MFEYIIISIVSLLAAVLTFFSGFGLGTILLPVFAFFFNIELAIAATAVVHFLNNIFKIFLVGKHANFKIILRFGAPALIFSFLGAMSLGFFSSIGELYRYNLFGREYSIHLVKLVIACLLIFFSIFELNKKLRELSFDKKYLSIGGVLSGFFGGLSGQQGALRSAFLSKAGLSKEEFIASSVAIAFLIDIARLSIYGANIFKNNESIANNSDLLNLIIVGALSAFIGAVIGKKVLKKITLKSIQTTIGIMLIIIALLLGFGII